MIYPVPKPTGRKRDKEYLAAVHELTCILRRAGTCWGNLEANHVGERPLGRKCDDTQTVPMCTDHHRQWTDNEGYFHGWTKELRRAWAEWAIENTRAAVALLDGYKGIAHV